MGCALAGLYVLERDVVHRLPTRERMADVLEHLHAGRLDVDLRRADAERAHEIPRVAIGVIARREARHRVGENVRSRQPELIHRAGGDDQRLRRIEATRYANYDLVDAGSGQALDKSVYLNVVRFVAAAVALRRVVWD